MPFVWQRHPTSELAYLVKSSETRFKLKDYLLSGLIVRNTFIGVISARKRTAVDEAEAVVAGLADDSSKQFVGGGGGGGGSTGLVAAVRAKANAIESARFMRGGLYE